MHEVTVDEWEVRVAQRRADLLYVYAPLCGTCAVASRMLAVIEELYALDIPRLNASCAEDFARRMEISSVPCLLLVKGGVLHKRIFAFRSVPDLAAELSELTLSR